MSRVPANWRDLPHWEADAGRGASEVFGPTPDPDGKPLGDSSLPDRDLQAAAIEETRAFERSRLSPFMADLMDQVEALEQKSDAILDSIRQTAREPLEGEQTATSDEQFTEQARREVERREVREQTEQRRELQL